MDLRDRDFLDNQRGRIGSKPRHHGVLISVVIAVFLVGITIGGFGHLVFGHKTEPPLRTAFNEGTAELSFFLNGVPVTPHNP
jgi:hypothetical protein